MKPEYNGHHDDALRALEELEARASRLLPDWRERGPEDPARVLLECFAIALAGERRELEVLAERLLPRLLLELGEEPRWSRPAHAVICLVGRPDLEEAVRVPMGTGVTATRSGDVPVAARLSFETRADAWLTPARLCRALVLEGERRVVLPVFQPRRGGEEDDGSETRDADVALFSAAVLDRHLYLGDPAWELLKEPRNLVVLEWPGAPALAAEAAWEYSVRGGWRLLPADFFETRAADGTRLLRARLEGPLPDFAQKRIESAEFPWLRLSLPARRAVTFSPPRIAWLPPRSGRKGAAEVPRGTPRPVARLLCRAGERWQDHSLTTALRVGAAMPGDDWQPAVYLGWDRALPASVHFGVSTPSPPPGFPTPQLEWEYSSAKGFRGLKVKDDTLAFSRSGTVSWGKVRGWAATERFGERLCWIRARWVEGSYYVPPRVRAVFPGAVEVVEGTTLSDHPTRLDFDGGRRALFPPPLEGEFERFSVLEIDDGGEWRALERPAEGRSPREGEFQLRRRPGGGVEVELSRSRPGAVEARVPEIRVGLGSALEVPEGTLNFLEAELAGLREIIQPLPAAGGGRAEGTDDLLRRLREEWRTGFRAVTAEDYCRLVRAVDSGITRVEAFASAELSHGVTVVVLAGTPWKPGEISPARLAWLRSYLEERAPVGTVLEVVEPCAVPYEVSLSTAALAAVGERLEALEAELRSFVDPLRGGPQARGYPLARGLREDDLRPIISRFVKLGSDTTKSEPVFFVRSLLGSEGSPLSRWALPRLERVVAVQDLSQEG